MSVFYDGNGNAVPVGVGYDVVKTALTDCDIVAFGDSNVYYTYGHAITEVGSVFYNLWSEFRINSLVNNGQNGAQTSGVWANFKNWATAENIERYNKESTILIFHCGTNDRLDQWTGDYRWDFSDQSTWTQVNNAVWGLGYIAQFIEQFMPKCKKLFVIPTATDWSKWTGSTEPDNRNMDEKYPYIVSNLNLWHFPYIDAYNQSGITPEILSDGIHIGGGGIDYTTIATKKYYRFLRGQLVGM